MTRSLDKVKGSILGEERVDAAAEQGSSKAAAVVLVEYVRSRFKLGISHAGETFAVPIDGPRVVQMLRGGSQRMRGELLRYFYEHHGRPASSQALTDALATLDGFAQATQPVRLWQRVARDGEALWLDLGDREGRAVRIGPGSWSIEERPPVLFKRTVVTGALPAPVRGGDLEPLWDYLNVVPEDRALVLAWLIGALEPDLPHPILGVFGQQGSGKTTAMTKLVQLIDDGIAVTQRPPRDADSWITAASASWIIALDNISGVPAWLSDALCRVVTGEGDVRRKLYTDADLHAVAFRRVVALSGIDLGSLAGDLADRLLPITLAVISEEARRDERLLGPAWERARPSFFGAFLDLAAGVLAQLPLVRPERLPRMADFARILAAVDELLGTDGLQRYLGAQGRHAAEALTDDPFITRVMERLQSEFDGTSADLLRAVTPEDEHWRKPKSWPDTARAVTVRLRKQAPVMRKLGWHVSDDDGANKQGVVRWKMVAPSSEVEEGQGMFGN